MGKRFYKEYSNNNRLEISYIAGLPAISEDKNLDNPPDEEMEEDKKYFKDRLYNENCLTELQQRGFSEDVQNPCICQF